MSYLYVSRGSNGYPMGSDIHRIWTWIQFFTRGFFSWAGKDCLHGYGYGFDIVQPDPNPTHCHPYSSTQVGGTRHQKLSSSKNPVTVPPATLEVTIIGYR